MTETVTKGLVVELPAAAALLFRPVSNTTRTEEVTARIRDAIQLGLIGIGAQLPNEEALARSFGVSVVTVREALGTIRAEGLIDTRRGRQGGSFVAPVPDYLPPAPGYRFDPQRVADLGEHMSALLGHAAQLAAERLTADEAERIGVHVQAVAAAVGGLAAARAETLLIVTIAASSQSARLTREQLRLQREWAPLAAEVLADPSNREQIVAQLQAIVDALRDGDAARARTASQTHVAVIIRLALRRGLHRLRDEAARGVRN